MFQIIMNLPTIIFLVFSVPMLASNSALIFHAERDDASFFIIGTKHDVSPSQLPAFFQEFIENRIKESNGLVVESIAPAQENIVDFFQILKDLNALDDKPQTNSVIIKLLDQIKLKIAKKFNVHEEVLYHLSFLKPWAALMIASYAVNLEQNHASWDDDIVRQFIIYKDEKESGKPLNYFGLESRNDFIAAFARESFEPMAQNEVLRQAEFVLQNNRLDEGFEDYDYAHYSDNFDEINMAYDQGQIKHLFKSSTDVRNLIWIKNLEQLIEEGKLKGKSLIVVGLSHLLGNENGLLALLVNHGFRVERYRHDPMK